MTQHVLKSDLGFEGLEINPISLLWRYGAFFLSPRLLLKPWPWRKM
jgi:hypothetical protein